MHDFWILIAAVSFFNVVIGGYNCGSAFANLRFDSWSLTRTDRVLFWFSVGYVIFAVCWFVFCAVQVATSEVR